MSEQECRARRVVTGVNLICNRIRDHKGPHSSASYGTRWKDGGEVLPPIAPPTPKVRAVPDQGLHALAGPRGTARRAGGAVAERRGGVMTAPIVTPLAVLGERHGSRVSIDPNGCWIWTGARNLGGYGRARLDGRMQQMHRVTYLAVHGSVPEGLELDHLCRVTSCCNPDHLEPVTHAENIRRGSQNRKRPTPKTHCKRGHELTPENLLASGQGRRQCRKCHNANRNERDREARRLKGMFKVGVLSDAPEGPDDDQGDEDDDVAGTDDEAAAS